MSRKVSGYVSIGGEIQSFLTLIFGIPWSCSIALGPSSRVRSDGYIVASIRAVLVHVGLPGKII